MKQGRPSAAKNKQINRILKNRPRPSEILMITPKEGGWTQKRQCLLCNLISDRHWCPGKNNASVFGITVCVPGYSSNPYVETLIPSGMVFRGGAFGG